MQQLRCQQDSSQFHHWELEEFSRPTRGPNPQILIAEHLGREIYQSNFKSNPLLKALGWNNLGTSSEYTLQELNNFLSFLEKFQSLSKVWTHLPKVRSPLTIITGFIFV